MHRWKEKDIYSVMFIETIQQFYHEWLLHNLRKPRVPEFMIKWVKSFLSERDTRLRFSGVDLKGLKIYAGVTQGLGDNGKTLSPL